MKRNRANRTEFPPTQGYDGQGTPLNGHAPRVGVAKWKRRRKCRCKENCGGHKRNTAAEALDWKKDQNLT